MLSDDVQVIRFSEDRALQIRVDPAEVALFYCYGDNPRWRKTPVTVASFQADPQAAQAAVYDFFDQQWRGC